MSMVTSVATPPESPAVPARKLRVPGWVRAVISLGLLAALLFMLDLGKIGSTLLSASPLMLLLLLGIVYSERVYSAVRWYQVLRWSGANVPLRVVIRISFVSAFAGLFLPGIVGTETFRVIGLARYSADLPMAVSSVLIDRLLAVFMLVPFVLIGIAIAPLEMPPGIAATAWLTLAAAIGCLFLLLHTLPRRVLAAVMPEAATVRFGGHLSRIYAALDAYQRRPVMLVYALLLSAGFQFLRVLVVWASVRAVGIEVAFAYVLIFAPIIALLSLAPISFVGLGVREASYVYLFALVAVAAEKAFAASVLVQVTGLLSCLPGAWLYARGNKRRRKAQEVQLCEPS
jgi:glycosyltransferase 2 family protein